MILSLRLAFRNALRNGRRTALTTATVTIGTAFVVVTLAWLTGIFDGMVDQWTEVNGPIRVVTTAYADREQLNPLHENIPEADPVMAKIEQVPGVALAAPRIQTGVLVSKGEELGDDGALLVGASDDWYTERLLPIATFSAGGWLDRDADDEQVVIGARVARDLGAIVGDEILVMGNTQYGSMAPISAVVVGIITGNSAIDQQAYVRMDIARWIVDIPDGAIEILVYPEQSSRASVDATAAAVQHALGEGYRVTPWMRADLWSQMVPILDGMKYILSAIIVFIMALAIFNTMTMSVLERTAEIGVMRAMGQSRLGAVTSFLFEATLIGLAGAILGLAIGAGPALYMENVGMSFSQDVLDDMGGEYAISAKLYADLTLETVLMALGVGLSTAVLGALLPSLRAASIPPSVAMRSRR